ncbi:hypothetical protein RBH26_17590 [Natronolimnohabitans sp. A-GB9]|uniref:hypothetical protein n=1 Tax=Natronolimnohabitans sp. A-GB9 TaxID=3069757 RepID=UPI0027B667F7|nr:hypothetical protein [Natronolimnohabitans sp. A-GB9]MDQ2052289.1 hypothetical protein [Natronolimnohabitans sp. A-GB9]
MGANSSDTGKLASSLHRSILGALLAIAGLIGLGWVIEAIAGGSPLFGALGLVIAGFAAFWIVSLFVEGTRER